MRLKADLYSLPVTVARPLSHPIHLLVATPTYLFQHFLFCVSKFIYTVSAKYIRELLSSVMPCTQTEVLRFFGETYCLSLQGLKVKQEISRRKQAEPLFFILEDGTVCLTIHRWNFIRLLPFVATVLRAWHPTIMTECCEIYRTVRTSMCGALLSSLHTSQAFEPTSPFIIILIQTKPNPPLFPEASRFATTVGSLSLFNHVRVSAARMVTLTRRDY